MTNEESKTVKIVYARFIENENDDWTDLDENLTLYGQLGNKELVKQTKAKIKIHSKGIFRCVEQHPQEYCMSPLILESAEAIVNLYDETKVLHPKNSYILCYYLVLSELKLIYIG